jgi:hypothetical protein
MNNERGLSKWAVLIIIALAVAGFVLAKKYLAKPIDSAIREPVETGQRDIEKAKQAKEIIDRANDAMKKANDAVNKESQ